MNDFCRYSIVGAEKSSEIGAGKAAPTIRIKARYQTLEILPLPAYAQFLGYLQSDYGRLCAALEPRLTVKAKEELATSFVRVMHVQAAASEFIADLIMAEVGRVEDEHLMFRGNSLATKSMEAYLKLVGSQYLKETLVDVVAKVVDANADLEVDPAKIYHISQLEANRRSLTAYVELTWRKINSSVAYFPTELITLFSGKKI